MSTGSGFTLSSWEAASGCSRKGSRRWRSSSSKPIRPALALSSTFTSQQASPNSAPLPPGMSDHSDSLVLLSCTDLLDWQGSYCRLVVDGQAVHLTDVS